MLFGAEPSPQFSPSQCSLYLLKVSWGGHDIASPICSQSGALQQERALTTLIISYKIWALKFRWDNRIGTEAFLEIASWSLETISKDLHTNGVVWSGELAQQFRVLAALSEDLGQAPSTLLVAYSYLYHHLAARHTCGTHTYMQAKCSHTKQSKKNSLKKWKILNLDWRGSCSVGKVLTTQTLWTWIWPLGSTHKTSNGGTGSRPSTGEVRQRCLAITGQPAYHMW